VSQPLQRLCEHMSCRSAAHPASSHAMRFAGNIILWACGADDGRCTAYERSRVGVTAMKLLRTGVIGYFYQLVTPRTRSVVTL
jgi:hypothetical protein